MSKYSFEFKKLYRFFKVSNFSRCADNIFFYNKFIFGQLSFYINYKFVDLLYRL